MKDTSTTNGVSPDNTSLMSGQVDGEMNALKSVYEISIETRNFEIRELIQRNNFFMLFQGVLLAGVIQSQSSKPFVEFAICLTGVFVSLYQLQMAAGAKFWQEWWEARVEDFEVKLCESIKEQEKRNALSLFSLSSDHVRNTVQGRLSRKNGNDVTNWLIMRSYSVSRAPIKVAVILILTWVILLAQTIDFAKMVTVPSLVKGFVVYEAEKKGLEKK